MTIQFWDTTRRILAALEVCREHEESGRCGVIDSISASARSRLSRKRLDSMGFFASLDLAPGFKAYLRHIGRRSSNDPCDSEFARLER